MNQKAIFERIKSIFREVLDNDHLALTCDSCCEDVENWDSLTNVSLFMAIQDDFQIRFSIKEIEAINSIGDIVRAVMMKLGE